MDGRIERDPITIPTLQTAWVRRSLMRRHSSIVMLALLLAPVWARADWLDAAWPYRRAVDVTFPTDPADGADLAYADIFTDGHALPDGSDIRVATEDNRPVPARVLMTGPGDRLRVAFNPIRPIKRYYVYFGNPTPPPPRAGLDVVKFEQGLLLEVRSRIVRPADSFKQMQEAWDKSDTVLGRTIWDKAFIGVNPFGQHESTLMKLSGMLHITRDGDHTFAMSADRRAALYIDGDPVLFCRERTGDVHINARHSLSKGRHAIVIYQENANNNIMLSVAWLPPGFDPMARRWSVVERDLLGEPIVGHAGAMDELRHTLTADFDIEQEGECFFADGYSLRYHFAANPPKVAAAVSYTWDFGDGQTSAVPETQHVYLTDGIYPVKLTVRAGGNTDTQTIRLAVHRDFAHVDHPSEDELAIHARMVATYVMSREPEEWMPRLAWLEFRADNLALAAKAADKVAAARSHPDAGDAQKLLRELTRELAEKGQLAVALDLWSTVPAESDLQPIAAEAYARMLLWWTGDTPHALQVLQPFATGAAANSVGVDLKRIYAQALLLNKNADEAGKIFATLPIEGDRAHQAAISGAEARTVEYYITTNDWESGEEAWNTWMSRYPSEFAQGYSVLLKTKLMEEKKAPIAAARIAEAFALAVPGSSYSPQLLDRASKLIAQVDPAKSRELHELLKKRYPEDPLSQ